MPRLQRLIDHPLVYRVFLGVLASTYLIYLVVFMHVVNIPFSTTSGTIIEHPVDENSNAVFAHWTVSSMNTAINVDVLNSQTSTLTQESIDANRDTAAKQQGQLPHNAELPYPLSTVGKVFFTNNAGQAFVCSGAAVASRNHSVVDTAGHCLYWFGEWMQNVIFCPLYEYGNTPYGCWAARDLEVPSDWIHAKPSDFHHDFGMAIVAPNSQGNLTDLVGGAGWAYNQSVDSAFYAYGYPAGYPYDGHTRQSCENQPGTSWQHGDGMVVSILCDMTGGSSGGPWFIQIDGNWYLNGHNDFVSRLRPGHMFSPYYDDTWYALYEKAQQS